MDEKEKTKKTMAQVNSLMTQLSMSLAALGQAMIELESATKALAKAVPHSRIKKEGGYEN